MSLEDRTSRRLAVREKATPLHGAKKKRLSRN